MEKEKEELTEELAEGLTIEKFGALVDEFLEKNRVEMLITLPEGSMDAEVDANVEGGPTIQFYILLHAIGPIFDAMCDLVQIDPEKKDELIDGVLDMIKDALKE